MDDGFERWDRPDGRGSSGGGLPRASPVRVGRFPMLPPAYTQPIIAALIPRIPQLVSRRSGAAT